MSDEHPEPAGDPRWGRPVDVHLARDRAESFGAEADRYERARPDYPAELGDDLVGDRPRRVLDVGCGTGKAARLFTGRGCSVLGVEVDPRMAAIAQLSGLEVEIGAFETWDRRGRSFDLVASGQAWHWVDPVVGPQLAADALREDGVLALFWNYRRTLGREADRRLNALYASNAAEVTNGPLLAAFNREAETSRHVDALAASGRFHPTQIVTYAWRQRYTRAEWLDLARTQSDHMALPPARLDPLLREVGVIIDDLGGSLDVEYETICIRADRRE